MTEAPAQSARAGLIIRRILAAFGPATLSPGALAGAVDLAGRLGAELDTLFVEDVTLLRWSELPFVRQVALHGQVPSPLSQGELELQFRALAADARTRLTAFTASQQLRCSFRIARGPIAGEVIAAAAQTDLLVLGSSSRPIAREALLEPSVRQLIGSVERPVLLLRPEQAPRDPVHVVLEDLTETGKLVDAARALATAFGKASFITVWAPSEIPFERALEQELGDRAPAIRVQRYVDVPPVDTLLGAVGSGTLVLSAGSPLLRVQSWWPQYARARCALLTVA